MTEVAHFASCKLTKHSDVLFHILYVTITNTVYGKKSFLSTESDTKILLYFAYKVGIISSYQFSTS